VISADLEPDLGFAAVGYLASEVSRSILGTKNSIGVGMSPCARHDKKRAGRSAGAGKSARPTFVRVA
jgi:hypothetical protein